MTEPGGLNVEELQVLARRQRETEAKRERRARQAKERARAALAANPGGYVVPPMPAGLTKQRRWLRAGHDAYSARKITLLELHEMRRSVSTQADTYKAGAVVGQSFAAERAAAAQERMADVLAAHEHGGTAVMLLARLQESLTEGKRRPLPGRVHVLTSSSEPAS